MNKLILTLALAVLCAPAFGQKKKGKEDPMQLRIDSLTQVNATLAEANAALTLRADSLGKEAVKYKGVYTAVKEKVLKYEFPPERTPELIDSLATVRQSAFNNSKAVQDSLVAVRAENKVLQERIATMETASKDHAKLTEELEELKRLLDMKILTQEEFDVRKKQVLAKW